MAVPVNVKHAVNALFVGTPSAHDATTVGLYDQLFVTADVDTLRALLLEIKHNVDIVNKYAEQEAPKFWSSREEWLMDNDCSPLKESATKRKFSALEEYLKNAKETGEAFLTQELARNRRRKTLDFTAFNAAHKHCVKAKEFSAQSLQKELYESIAKDIWQKREEFLQTGNGRCIYTAELLNALDDDVSSAVAAVLEERGDNSISNFYYKKSYYEKGYDGKAKEHREAILFAKFQEIQAEKALKVAQTNSTEFNTTQNNEAASKAKINYWKAQLTFRETIYNCRTSRDPGDNKATEKLQAVKSLQKFVGDEMHVDNTNGTIVVNPSLLNTRSDATDGKTGEIRSAMDAMRSEQLRDKQYGIAKKSDLGRERDAAAERYTAKARDHLKNPSEEKTSLRKLQLQEIYADLKFRRADYAERIRDGREYGTYALWTLKEFFAERNLFGYSAADSASEKLKATESMIKQVEALQRLLTSTEAEIRSFDNEHGDAAMRGSLGELNKKLQALAAVVLPGVNHRVSSVAAAIPVAPVTVRTEQQPTREMTSGDLMPGNNLDQDSSGTPRAGTPLDNEDRSPPNVSKTATPDGEETPVGTPPVAPVTVRAEQQPAAPTREMASAKALDAEGVSRFIDDIMEASIAKRAIMDKITTGTSGDLMPGNNLDQDSSGTPRAGTPLDNEDRSPNVSKTATPDGEETPVGTPRGNTSSFFKSGRATPTVTFESLCAQLKEKERNGEVKQIDLSANTNITCQSLAKAEALLEMMSDENPEIIVSNAAVTVKIFYNDTNSNRVEIGSERVTAARSAGSSNAFDY